MWLLLSIGTSFFESLADLSGKVHAQKLHVLVSAWSVRTAVFMMLLPVWYVIDGNSGCDPSFWKFTIGSALINTVTSVLYMRALKEGELSLCIPLLKLSPIWTIFTAPLINGERVSGTVIVGVATMALGTYLLNFSERKSGMFRPFTMLWSNTGMRSMLLVSMLWSISAPFDKEAIRHSSPLFFLVTRPSTFLDERGTTRPFSPVIPDNPH
jgi:uncharacterized membrane protein